MGEFSTLLKNRIHYCKLTLAMCFAVIGFTGFAQSGKSGVEQVSMRDEYSRTFKNADGTFTKQQGEHPLHYKGASGKWETIQQLPERSKSNPASIGISRTDLPISINTQQGTSQMALQKGKEISFGKNAKVLWIGKDKSVVKTIAQSSSITKHDLIDNQVTLKNVFPGIDRNQQLDYDHLRTDYIINQSLNTPASVEYVVFEDHYVLPSQWRIDYASGEMTAAGWRGDLTVFNEKNEKAGTFSLPVFYDAYQSTDKATTLKHVTRGTYRISKSGEGYTIQILVPTKWLNAPERVYPVTVDPTVTGTKGPSGNVYGYAYNAGCQETLTIAVPAGTVTGTSSTYSITAQNGGYRSEQVSRIGYGGLWTANQTNATASAGTFNYSLPSITLANGVWCGGNMTFTWQAYRTWDADGFSDCDQYNQYRSGNWVVNVTYTATVPGVPASVGWTAASGGTATAPASCGAWSNTWCAGSGTYTNVTLTQGVNYTVENTGDATCGTALSTAYLQAWWNGGATACGYGSIDSPGSNTITFNAVISGDHIINVSSNSCGAANSCGGATGHDFSGGSAVLRYKQNTTVTNTTSTADICLTGTKSLTATLNGSHNNPTIAWSVVSGGGSIAGSTYTPTSAGSKTIRATVGGCTSDVTFNVIDPGASPITVSGTTSICSGGSTVLTASGGTSYSWSPATGLSATTGTSVTASPGSTQSYTVTETSGACVGNGSVTVTVASSITPTFNAVAPICSGAALSALPTTSTNGITGSWSPALDNTNTTTYTFTPDAGQCGTTTTLTITVNPNVTPTFAAVAAICSGGSLSALPTTSTNGITGSWSPALDNTATTTYTFTPDAGQCSSTATMTITVNPNVTPTFAAVGPICSGDALAALPTTSTNGITGSWSPALDNTTTTTYTFTPDAGQCATTTTMTITVNTLPTAGVTASAMGICPGETSTLTATGGTTYTWSPATGLSATTGSVVNASPTTTTTYTVTATTGSCSDTETITITVTPLPVTVTSDVPSVCDGESATLTASGATTYTWTPGTGLNMTTGNEVIATPSSTQTYTVTGTSGLCSNSQNITITVKTNPTVSVTPSVANLCAGNSITLTGVGASTYVWLPTLSSGSTVTVSPMATTTYTALGTASNGCVGQGTATVTVTTPPSATISYAGLPFCTTTTAPQAVTRTGTAGGTYTSTAGLAINASTGAITPSTSTAGTYTVTYSIPATGGCSLYTTTTSVTINAAPTATISYPGSPFCGDLSIAQNVAHTGATGGTYSAGAGLTIDPATGAITPSTSTAGVYTVTYTIAAGSGCPAITTTASVTVTAPPAAAISYAGTPFCSNVSAPQAVTFTGTTGGTYTSTAGLVINSTTGAITPSTSSPGTYMVTYTVPASGGCALYTTTTSITINPIPVATISYPGSPFCGNLSTPQNVAQTGTTGGLYSSTAGLQINAGTGAITPSLSTAGTYTVTYTIAAGSGCPVVTATASVTVTTAPAAAISYTGSPFCTNAAAQAVTLTGTTGGTYSSTAGLAINSTTGAITPASSSAGTYTITYTIAAAGGCPLYTTTGTATITTLPVATITYPGSPFCGNLAIAQNVAQTGTAGGTYTSTAGLTIDATTGAITPSTSTAGTYTVTYTIAAGSGCPAVTATASVTITTAPAATISYASPFCMSAVGPQAVTFTGTTGGTYSSTAGLTLNATTGAVTPSSSTAGTYTVTYTIAAAGGCPVYTTTATVVINPVPTATISYAGTPLCGNLSTPQNVTQTGTAGGTYTSTAGLTIDATTGSITPSTSTPGTYTVTYTMAVGGCPSVTTTTSVTITTPPAAAITYAGSPFCNSVSSVQAVTHTGTTGGVYSSTAGLTISAINGGITPSSSVTGTYTVTYTMAAANGCPATTATTTVVVNPIPTATITYAGSPFCGNIAAAQNVTQTGTAGGTYTSTAGLTINATTGAITPSTSTAGTYTVTYTIAAGSGCPAVTATASVTITTPPAATITYAGSPFCSSTTGAQAVTRTGTTGGTYSSTAGLIINASTGAVTPSSSTPGTYTVTYTVAAASGCPVYTTTATVVINPIPTATITYAGSPFCGNLSAAQAVTQTGTTGGTYTSTTGLTINAATGAITPSTSTAGTYTVTYTIAAGSGCPAVTATTSVTITTPPAATITYAGSPFCSSVSSAQAVTFTGTTGGVYSSTPGLTISAVNGSITPSSSITGTYTVTYTIAAANGCPATTATTSVTVNPLPAATISYTGSPFCGNLGAQNVTQTGTTGGTYSSTAGLTINASTGAITPSSSTAGTYTITYTIAAGSGCPAVTATTSVTITAPPAATITYAGAPFCTSVTGAQAVTHTGTTGGTYSSTTGLTLNATTGTITPSTSTAGTYTVTYTMAAANGCPAMTATTSVTITTAPTATISYAGSPYCASITTPQAVTLTGTAGGTFSSTAGLTINATTGAVTPSTSTAGTYTVTYTVAASGGCSALSVTTTVTINAIPTAGISYSAAQFCSSITAAQPVTLTGTTGGTFSSTTGLSINATTGAITPSLSTPGSYTITYAVTPGGCSTVSATASVEIVLSPTASISYAGPYCQSIPTAQTVTLNGTGNYTGGTYTGAPAGLSINATTGEIIPNLSTGGTYVVTYTVPASLGCSSGTATANVTIIATPSAVISYAGPFCSNLSGVQAVTFSGVAGGSYSAPSGLTIDATTGGITPSTSTPGTYVVTYNTPSSGSCPPGSATATVNILATPVITSLADQTLCDLTYTLPTIGGTSLTGNEMYYTGTNGGGVAYAAGDVISATTTLFIYDANGTCSDQDTVLITINQTPVITNPGNQSSCGAYTLPAIAGTNLSGSEAYYNNSQLLGGTVISGPISSTQTVWIYDANGTCSDEESFVVTINTVPDASFSTSNYCGGVGNAPVVTGATGGTFSLNPVPADGATINATTGVISGGVAGTTYTIEYTVGTACPASTQEQVTFNALPASPATSNDTTYCSAETFVGMTATAGAGGTLNWFDNAALTSQVGTGTSVVPANTNGTTTYYVTETVNGCQSLASTVDVTVNPSPAAPDAGSSVTYCKGDSIKDLTATGIAGNTFNWYNDAALTSPYGTGSTVTPLDALGAKTYYVTQTGSGCQSAAASVTVTINDCFELEVTSAFTPGDGDNTNNLWEIPELNDRYPNCKVTVFNRWGQILFESDGYSIPWDGTYKGENLPVGSYYYIIELNDAENTPKQTGTVTIIRN